MRPARRSARLGTLATALLAAFVVACGSGDGGPGEVAEQFTLAIFSEQPADACALFSTARLESVDSWGSVEACEASPEAASPAVDAGDVTVQVLETEERGDEATVSLLAQGEPDDLGLSLELVREDGEWRVEDLTPPDVEARRDRAADGDAKVFARNAQVATEIYARRNDESFEGADVGALVEIDPSLADADLELTVTGEGTYELTAVSESGSSFSVERLADGSLVFSCDPEGVAGCPDGGDWSNPLS